MKNMSSLITLIIVMCFLSIQTPDPVHALTPDKVFAKVKDSVVVVEALDGEGEVDAQGSGVLLPSGKIVTNCHVVEEGASYRVGRGDQFVPATLYAEDEDKDLCLLYAEDITGTPAQLGTATGLKVGEPVYAVGAPQGLELSISEGIVSQLREGTPPLIQTTAAISPGSSGGGLFDADGRLVGLTTFYLEDGQNLNFAMPVEWIDEIKPYRKIVDLDQIEDPAPEDVVISTGPGRPDNAERIADDLTEWSSRAIALSEMEDWQGMLKWCLRWAKSEPRNAEAWITLGDAYDELDRYQDAIAAYRQALSIDSNDSYTWYNLGYVYSELNRYDDAIIAFRKTLNIDPDDADAWYSLGYTYSELDRYDDAITAYRKSLYIDSDDADAWFGLGEAYAMSGNRKAALDAVQELQHIDPEMADDLFNLIEQP